jgi:predicted Zn-dependent peptidase
MGFIRRFILFLCFFFASAAIAIASDSSSKINLDVKEFTLKNGMMFLVVERDAMPQVACRVAIRAGSALEDNGKTGIAHMLEHMMFKGTKNFGALDFKKDQELQKKIESAYQVVLSEQSKRNPDPLLVQAKQKEMERLRLEVQKIYVPQAFSSQLGRNGAVGVNAFTSKDETQYIMSVPSDMIEQWFSIVSEQLFEPAWREFYVEKEVVQREWAFRYVNNPLGAAWLDFYATAYSAHPYKNPTIGWKSDMEKFNSTDAKAFHERYYNPSNAVCVLVGDVTVENAKKLAEIYFGRYPAGPRAPEKVTAEPIQHGPKKTIRFLKGARTPLVLIGFHAAPMATKDFFALDVATMILSHGRSARFTQDVVNKGLALAAWAYNPDNRYGGMFIVGGSPDEPEEFKKGGLSGEEERLAYTKACEQLEDTLLAQVEKMKAEPVSQRELQRIRKLSYRDLMDKLRKNEDLATTLASLEVQVGWRYLLTYVDRISEVTAEDLSRTIAKYICTENKTSVYVIPGGKPEQPPEGYQEIRSLSGSAAAKVVRPSDFSNHSMYPTPKSWKHPLSFDRIPKKIHYAKARRSEIGGVPVFYLRDQELPLIDLTLLVKAGDVDVESTKIGLSQVLNESLISGGTERHSPAEFAMILDENAIRLSLSVDEENSVLHLSVLKEDWDRGLALLEEILTQPRFDPEIVRVAKTQLMTTLKRQGGDARAVSMREGMIWHFKGHPYGRDPLKGLETVPQITRDDLLAFLRNYFIAPNIIACVAGDIEEEPMLQSLGKLFRSLGKGQGHERQIEDPQRTPPVLALIHKPGQFQSQVIMILPSVKRTNPDYWKLSLLMNLFGGNESLMSTRLRDDLGLVYSAWFQEDYRWKAGMLIGYIGCKADKTGEAIAEIAKIMTALGTRIPEDELEQKRLDLLNSFVFNVDTPSELVGVYGRYYMRKEPLDTLDRIQDAFMSSRGEELEALARRFLDPKGLQIFVVADKTTNVKRDDGAVRSLEENLKSLSTQLGLPYAELPLR